ncbi:MAG: Asp-tRNA(Asn)/Glu-tRNA(Gln) amidotransferase subunit GatB [Patescibacteria group bacterium]
MANKYYPTIGLEIHAELKTLTKMFCACKNDPDEEKPNTNICPVCMGHPGAMPTLNKKAIENVIKVGLAVGGKIADFTEFDRKNYFYPDIPKGYQISQYKYPIVSSGRLSGMDITRIHLEEDTANNKHDRGDFSLIDFNRSGVPLMELVTEATTFQSTEEAAKGASKFGKELQLILWYLGVSEVNMEKGEMRVEANISVSTDPRKLGTKVEVKNLNSFKSVEKAIKFEIDRMIGLHESRKGAEIAQETRGWDEAKQKTFSQRKKEGSADYRYFPEPDLPKLYLHKVFDLEKMKKELPELPEMKRKRYKKRWGLKDEDIEIYIGNYEKIANFFEETAKILNKTEKIKIAANYITTDWIGLKKNNEKTRLPSAENFAELINLVAENKISSRAAKDILAMMTINDESPLKIATEKNLLQSSDTSELKKIAQKIIDANPKVVADYKGGKVQAVMSLVGQIMKETKGSANPAVTKQLLVDLLK